MVLVIAYMIGKLIAGLIAQVLTGLGFNAILAKLGKPEMSIAEFQRYWLEVHGPLGAALPVVRRYVQSHTRRGIYESGRTPAYDGVALTWFDDTQAMRVSATLPEYARLQADEPNFLAPGPVPVIITKEHVIVA